MFYWRTSLARLGPYESSYSRSLPFAARKQAPQEQNLHDASSCNSCNLQTAPKLDTSVGIDHEISVLLMNLAVPRLLEFGNLDSFQHIADLPFHVTYVTLLGEEVDRVAVVLFDDEVHSLVHKLGLRGCETEPVIASLLGLEGKR